MLWRDTFPSTSAHDQAIDLSFGRVRRDTSEKCHVFWDVPWYRTILTDAVPLCCSDDDR